MPTSHRSSSGSRLALFGKEGSPFGPAEESHAAEIDPDLAALKSSWSWNFARAPRTEEQEEKQWFQPTMSTRSRHRMCALSCSRCGQALGVDELISHQADCLGEREVLPDDLDVGVRPRWKGPLDKEDPKVSRRLRLPDFDPLNFAYAGASTLRGDSDSPFADGFFVSGRPPHKFGGWASASSKAMPSSQSSAFFRSYGQASGSGWGAAPTGNAAPPPPPRKPPSPPPQRPSPPAASRPPPVAAAPSTAALDTAMASHDGSWARFETSQASGICYADVPWPDLSKSAPDALLVQHALRKALETSDVKSVLRKLQMRWHPDKWAQRFASRLSTHEADRVLTRVKEIAQLVNGLKAST